MKALYVAITFLYWISLYIYMPTLPVYVQNKVPGLAMVGVVLSMYGLWQAFIRLPLGIFADWLGRRKVLIIIGIALSGLGAYIMGTAQGLLGLIVGRAITGLAAGTWVLLVVVFSGLFPSSETIRVTSMLSFVGAAGRVLATGATGSLNQMGGYSFSFFLAVGAAALAILLILPTKEKRRPNQAPSARNIGRLILRRDVLVPALLNAVTQYVVWTATFGFLPILAKELGATDVLQSRMVSTQVLLTVLGSLFATIVVKRIGAGRLSTLGFIFLTIGIGAAAFGSSLLMLFVSQFCIGAAYGINNPVLMGMSIQDVEENERSTAMGLHQSVYGFGMFGGSWLSGVLANVLDIRLMFTVTTFVCLVMSLLVARMYRNG